MTRTLRECVRAPRKTSSLSGMLPHRLHLRKSRSERVPSCPRVTVRVRGRPPDRARGGHARRRPGTPSWPPSTVLRRPHVQRDARYMRHATQKDLDQLEALLAGLRRLPQLRERRRGYFSRGDRAFLHCHEDAGDYCVDVKLDSRFQRMKVTSRANQAHFLTRVKEALRVERATRSLEGRFMQRRYRPLCSSGSDRTSRE